MTNVVPLLLSLTLAFGEDSEGGVVEDEALHQATLDMVRAAIHNVGAVHVDGATYFVTEVEIGTPLLGTPEPEPEKVQPLTVPEQEGRPSKIEADHSQTVESDESGSSEETTQTEGPEGNQ